MERTAKAAGKMRSALALGKIRGSFALLLGSAWTLGLSLIVALAAIPAYGLSSVPREETWITNG
ncbi:MAG: hypothetical protein HZB26_06290, partial [Candidatus Hydrogenedentes bacterium]|nr:hypothetical protein [Candidatus Hydrogenedentota bacterium]